MGQVLAFKNTIDELVLEIRAQVHDAGRAETTCAKHQLQAGWRLLELRKRVEAGEAGNVTWWEWYDEKFTGHIKSRSYAEKLMRWARSDDPEGAMVAEQKRVREAVRAHSARAQSTRVSLTRKQNQSVVEYDIVSHAMRLVDKMDADQRERFDAAYREKFQ